VLGVALGFGLPLGLAALAALYLLGARGSLWAPIQRLLGSAPKLETPAEPDLLATPARASSPFPSRHAAPTNTPTGRPPHDVPIPEASV
jgi:hypothetical protein